MTSYDANGAPVEGEAVRHWKCECLSYEGGDIREVVPLSDHLAAVQRLERENERITEMAAKHECDLIAAKAQLAAAKRDYAIMDETDKAYIKAAHAELASLRTQLSAATAALEAAQKDAERFQ